ncbi:MAG: pyridoxal phosphate-dependent decarboxylase family protein [Planctomycetota bacterium]|jgi:L-2,4-diaminobutyrate decarboxylase
MVKRLSRFVNKKYRRTLMDGSGELDVFDGEAGTQAAAADRIRAAYSPGSLRELGHRLAELLAGHMSSVQGRSTPVLNWANPPDLVDLASQCLADGSQSDLGATADERQIAERFEALVTETLAHGHNLHQPRYIGHQVPAPVPIAGLFDAVGSVTNQVMAVFEMGPWATAVEAALVEKLGAAIGWLPGAFSGLVTHGGSLGNLTALLTARNVALDESWSSGLSGSDQSPVLVAHADAHYSVARAAGVIGVGSGNVVRVGLDSRRRMDPNQLDETLSSLRQTGTPIVAVSACACATPIGAFDPLDQLADVCRRHEVWLHVDAAHGGAACLSHKYRSLLQGIDQADSVVWDAHKMMFVPALCAFVLYRNQEHRFATFQQDAPYLFDPSSPGMAEFDSGVATLECTKRAAAFGLWGTWSLFGEQLFADLVDATFDLGRTFFEKLIEASDFEPLHEPQCNIVTFRHIPPELGNASEDQLADFHFRIRRELIQSGRFYIVQTRLDGQQALRVTIINPLTTPDDLDALLDAVRTLGRKYLTEPENSA